MAQNNCGIKKKSKKWLKGEKTINGIHKIQIRKNEKQYERSRKTKRDTRMTICHSCIKAHIHQKYLPHQL